jgi:metal-sulfur cluster biosynthetic enzyme
MCRRRGERDNPAMPSTTDLSASHSARRPLAERVEQALTRVIDPEVGLDVVSLGLVYGIVVAGNLVQVELTMTTPACPLAEQIVREAEAAVRSVDGVGAVSVLLVWNPPWTPARMRPEARRALGWST